MNPTHVIATGGVTSMLAEVLIWLSHWPLQPLDQGTALALAGLAVAFFGGGGLAIFNTASGNTPAGNPAPPPVAAPGAAPQGT